jgi:hypothetical protein
MAFIGHLLAFKMIYIYLLTKNEELSFKMISNTLVASIFKVIFIWKMLGVILVGSFGVFPILRKT